MGGSSQGKDRGLEQGQWVRGQRHHLGNRQKDRQHQHGKHGDPRVGAPGQTDSPGSLSEHGEQTLGWGPHFRGQMQHPWGPLTASPTQVSYLGQE